MSLKANACPRCLTLRGTSDPEDGSIHTCSPTGFAANLEHQIEELEAENTKLRAHRCEVGMEDPEVSLKHLASLPPEELAALNLLFNRKR